MFRCSQCDVNQDSCKSPARVVTHVRKVEYAHGENVSYGQEVVKEIDLCSNCVAKRTVAGTEVIVASGEPKRVAHTQRREVMKERQERRY